MLKGESEKKVVGIKFVVKCKSPPAAAARMVFTNTWHQNYYKIALASEILNVFHGKVGDTDEKGRRLILSALVHYHLHHSHQQQHIISYAHPSSIVLSFPPVVWPTNHDRVRLHTPQARRLEG